MKTIQTLVAIAGLTFAIHAHAVERNLEYSELPAAVKTAADEVVRDAKVIKVTQELEKTVYYTVEYAGRGGRTFEVTISTEGKVVQTGEMVKAVDTPEPARKVIEEKIKTVVWHKVVKLTRDGQVVYFVKFDRGGDNEGEFTVDANGKLVEDDDDDDKDKDKDKD